MSSEIFGQQLPAEVVREDHKLEETAESTHAALAKLRWHWTLDEENDKRVSLRQYARETGRAEGAIRKSAHGYVRYAHSAHARGMTISEAVERAGHAADKQIVIEAVAQTNGMTFRNARERHYPEVKAVEAAVEKKAEKLEGEGEEFTPEDRADYAKRLAETRKRLRDREERERQEYKASHSRQFMDALANVGKARQTLRAALKIVRDAELTDDEKELIEQANSDTQALSSMITAALTGESGVDWDRELAALDGRAHDAGE